MKRIWIIKAGRTFERTAREFGDFEQWTAESLGVEAGRLQIFDVAGKQTLPKPWDCAAIVITGSHAMVTDSLPWSVQLESWTADAVQAEVPLLGICYGHQLLARSMGGEVDYHPGGREVGTVEIQLLESSSDDPLFIGLSTSISAHVVHAQSVLRLPGNAVRLARNDFDANQAFRLGPRAWGVQFHPEYHPGIMRSYIEHLADELLAARRDVTALLQRVRQTPVARQIARRFGRLALGQDPASAG